jgi:deoxyribonuclease-4
MGTPVLLGSHMSVNGGLQKAFERGMQIGCTTMQIFTKNGSQWEGRLLTERDIGSYKTAHAKSTIDPVFAHAAYLINLCAADPGVLSRSRRAMEDELRRCEALQLFGLILHPGAHMGRGEGDGIRLIADSINHVHQKTGRFHTRTILETTAGQGTSLGYRFEQLRSILDGVEDRSRMAICLDTCHVFAAGYPIDTPKGWEETMAAFEKTIGLNHLVVLHVNDSKNPLGSRTDRHEHIGKGRIGREGFRAMMNDARLLRIPKILETEKSKDLHEDVENMAFLRSLLR